MTYIHVVDMTYTCGGHDIYIHVVDMTYIHVVDMIYIYMWWT